MGIGTSLTLTYVVIDIDAIQQIVGRERNQRVCHPQGSNAYVVDCRRVNSDVMSLRSLKRNTNHRETCRMRAARGSHLVIKVVCRMLAALTRLV